MRGWFPVLFGTGSADLMPVMPFGGAPNNLEDVGGGMARADFSLKNLFFWGQREWCKWSQRTDGFDLARYKGTRLFFQAHPYLNYIVHWTTDYKDMRGWPWQWFHPSTLINQPNHIIVWSKKYKPNTKGRRIFLKPPAIMESSWFFMSEIAKIGLFKWQASIIDIESCFFSNKYAKGSISVPGVKPPPTNAVGSITYWWLWDNGMGNGYYVQEELPDSYAGAHGKNVPYYIAFWGLYNQQTIWAYMPEGGYKPPGNTQRIWFKLSSPGITAIIRNGPFVSKGLTGSFSVSCYYKSYWQFGGPTMSYGVNPGTDPSELPPEAAPSSNLYSGMEIRDPEDVGLGVLHPWEARRGLITSRGYARLTSDVSQPASFTGPPGWLEPTEIEHWPSEEETSEEETEETETEA